MIVLFCTRDADPLLPLPLGMSCCSERQETTPAVVNIVHWSPNSPDMHFSERGRVLGMRLHCTIQTKHNQAQINVVYKYLQVVSMVVHIHVNV